MKNMAPHHNDIIPNQVNQQQDKQSESEIKFFEGPQSRIKELRFALKTFFELIRCFRKLHFVGPCVTVFGSARFKEGHPYYAFTREAASDIAKMGFTVMTGGGPGLMEAANRGAREIGGRSVGCNIQLPVEQQQNIYLDKWVHVNHFFIRKILLVKYSFAFIVMPGGFGTLDEYFEALTLIQTGKIKNFPIIIFNKEYHSALLEHIDKMEANGTIDKNDLKLLLVTDSIEEAKSFITEQSIKRYGLKHAPDILPKKWLFEKSLKSGSVRFGGIGSFVKAVLWPD